ncbi:MAG: M16 family metallopeptidase, partial [Sandaracinaceae bacterium]
PWPRGGARARARGVAARRPGRLRPSWTRFRRAGRPALLALLVALLASACGGRAALPPPREPLVATPFAAFRQRPPEVAEAERPPLPRVERTVLGNGLEVLRIRQPYHRVALLLVSRAAHEDLPLGLAGLSAFLARSLPRATDVSGTIVSSYLDRRGYEVRTYVGPDASGLGVLTDRARWREALADLAVAVRAPVFRADTVAEDRHRWAEVLERFARNAAGGTDLLARRLLFRAEERWGHRISGHPEAVRQFTAERLAQHHARTFVPNASALIVVGDLDLEDLGAEAEEAFGDWSRREVEPRGDGPAGVPLPDNQAWVIPANLLPQPLLTFSDRAPPLGHPDAPAFAVLARLAGGMFMARLNQQLRQRDGYTYGVSAEVEAARDYGLFRITTRVDGSRVAEALSAIRSEVRRLAVEGPTPGELATARTLAIEHRRAALENDWSAADVVARAFGAQVPTATLWREAEAMAEVDAEAVRDVARRWIRPDAGLFIAAGPLGLVQAGAQGAGFATVGIRRLGRF